jgi:hypothetical protein
MTITFSDIRAAVRSYLADNVAVTLTENEQGTYTMMATNAAAPDGLALRCREDVSSLPGRRGPTVGRIVEVA